MVSETGYKRRTLEEILNAKIEKAKELFGEDINTEENTILGKILMISAYDQYHIEEAAEQLYYSFFPQTAFGQSLDRLGWIAGITRKAATPAIYKVKVVGTEGATIGADFLVGVDPAYVGEDADLTFKNTQETIIDETGECEIMVSCTTAGIMGNVTPSIINRVVNPVAYVETVQGVSVVELAEDEESDYDFKKRYEIARGGGGSCTAASIVSALVVIPTVRDACVSVNESATETIDGVPPKTIACYVDGGANYSDEIGKAIFDKKPIGVGTHGTESVIVKYGAMSEYEVKFSYAKNANVYIKLTLTTNDKFETNGNKTIKQNVEAFIGSLAMGEQLVTTALYGDIYKVAGVVTANIETSTDGVTYTSDNIEVEAYERCVLNTLIINGETV